MKWALFPTESTTFMIASYPCASGSSTIKSTLMTSHRLSGIASECSSPGAVSVGFWSGGIGHMSLHIVQCNGTSVATNNSGTLAPEFSNVLHVLQFWCHDVGM